MLNLQVLHCRYYCFGFGNLGVLNYLLPILQAAGPEMVLFIKVGGIVIISTLVSVYHSWKLGLVALGFSPFLFYGLYYLSRFQTTDVFDEKYETANEVSRTFQAILKNDSLQKCGVSGSKKVNTRRRSEKFLVSVVETLAGGSLVKVKGSFIPWKFFSFRSSSSVSWSTGKVFKPSTSSTIIWTIISNYSSRYGFPVWRLEKCEHSSSVTPKAFLTSPIRSACSTVEFSCRMAKLHSRVFSS